MLRRIIIIIVIICSPYRLWNSPVVRQRASPDLGLGVLHQVKAEVAAERDAADLVIAAHAGAVGSHQPERGPSVLSLFVGASADPGGVRGS